MFNEAIVKKGIGYDIKKPTARVGLMVSLEAISFFALKFPAAANGFVFFPRFPLARLFKSPAYLHLAKNAFALQFLFQDPQRLVHIIIANVYSH
jgi:hypothetical protein